MPPGWVLALDAMGVVYRTRSITSEVVYPFAVRHGCTLPHDMVRALYRRARVGELTSAQVWRALGVDPQLEDACLEGHDLMPGAGPFLVWAERSFDRVVLLSNDVAEWSAKLRRRFDLDRFFDATLISGELKVPKPKPAAYKALIAAAKVAPEFIAFVDDKPANLDVAKIMGLRTVSFATPTESHPVVETFDELVQALTSMTVRP